MAKRSTSQSFAVFVVTTLLASAALACPSDSYDADQELAAIKQALPGAKLASEDKSEMDRLVHVASVNKESLSFKGIRMQSDARGKAMQMLGLTRIPARPDEEFKAVDDKLQDISALSEGEKEAVRLRDEAEKLWSNHQYDAARESLTKALNLLQIKLTQFRC
jgi:hypothetical protein